jgi:hypothetical protein
LALENCDLLERMVPGGVQNLVNQHPLPLGELLIDVQVSLRWVAWKSLVTT